MTTERKVVTGIPAMFQEEKKKQTSSDINLGQGFLHVLLTGLQEAKPKSLTAGINKYLKPHQGRREIERRKRKLESLAKKS